MGCFQAVQAMLCKESIGPATLMIAPAASSLSCPGVSGGCFAASSVSTFLHPFAPPELPGFFATMGALTPGRPALRLTREHEHRLWCHPGIPAFVIETSDHSVSNHLSPSQPVSGVFFLRWAYRIPAVRDRPFPGSKRQLGFAIP